MLGGTRIHTSPVAHATAMSVWPTPDGEAAERAVGAGVGVAAEDDLARPHQPPLGQDGVLDAGVAAVKVVLDALLAGELPR